VIAPYASWPKSVQILALAPFAALFGLLVFGLSGLWPMPGRRRRTWIFGAGLAFVIACCGMAVFAWSR
jgi:hypothetical protein